jgi:hypothetical protein
MKTENWILLIGASAILGWYYYNKGKGKTNQVSNTQVPMSPEPDVVPRKDMRREFRIVMPSDLISTSVRQKAQQLTNRRYAVDTAKLV